MEYVARLKSNPLKLALYWAFHSFIFAYVIERLYWEQRGMTVQDVVYTEIIYVSLVALLEIPTGYAADRWSRKWMMVVGGICTCLEFVILIFASSFGHFAAAVAIAAIGNAATSGTSNALLYDTLKVLGRESQFERQVGRIRFWKYAAHMAAALLGSVVAAKAGFLTNYWISLASTCVSLLVSLTLVEPRLRTTGEKQHPSQDLTRQAWTFLKGNLGIQFAFAYGVMVGSCLNYLDEFWQLYLDLISVPVILWGLVSAATSLLVALGSLVAHQVKQKTTYKALFSFILLIFASGLIMMAVLDNPAGLFFMLLAYGAVSLVDPLISGYLHHRTPSEFRATAESVQSLVSRVVTGGIGLIFGAISTRYAIDKGFLMIGALAMAYLGVFTVLAGRFLAEDRPLDGNESELARVEA